MMIPASDKFLNDLLFAVYTKVFYFIKWDGLVLRRSFIRRLVALNKNEENRRLKHNRRKTCVFYVTFCLQKHSFGGANY